MSQKIPKSERSIMIVDDEEDIVMVLKNGLEKIGFRVNTFNDPLVALSNFKEGLYDLVLLDIRMPKMDGFELYQNIKKIDGAVKICFMTAHEVYYEALRQMFPDTYSSVCFVKKPFAIEDFAKRLDKEIMEG